MSQVIVIGSSNTDLVVQVERLPQKGETVLGGELKTFFGGKGANQAAAAKKGGANVLFITKLGQDAYGEKYREHLLRLGIDPSGILRDEKIPSGTALIAIDKEGNNQIVVSPGANSALVPEDIERLKSGFFRKSVMLLQLEIPLETVAYSLETAKSLGIRTILNPAPAAMFSEKLLKNVDIITPNKSELEALTGKRPENEEETIEAAKGLLERGVKNVIVTLGEKGALLVTGEKTELFPAFKVKSVDTTAAGDAFNGMLASSLSEGLSLEQAVIKANATGALTTLKIGAQPSLPTRKEIEEFLEKQKS
jgi:ribokinase